MKRTLTVALLAIFGTALFVPVFAQDNFPDVPENHWAYEALENLKREGILVGYPDGTYKGSRSLTRYELAVALNAAYLRMKMMHDGLAEQIAEIRRSMGQGGGTSTDTAGMKALADRLTAVENQLKGMGNMAADMAAMKRMADEFQKELASMGVDVEGMKKDIAELQKKVAGGTAVGASVSISGDANLFVATGDAASGSAGVMGVDGRILGVDNSGNNVNFHRDLNVYHELATTLSGGGNGSPKWWGTVVFGNMVGTAGTTATSGFGDQSNSFGGQNYRVGSGDAYVQNFGVEIENGVAGLPFKATVGRIGTQTHNPFLFKRTDFTPYFANERWDNGDWTFDGAILNFQFGNSTHWRVYGGETANIKSMNGVSTQNLLSGGTAAGGAENFIASDLGFNLGSIGQVELSYLLFAENTTGTGFNWAAANAHRLQVYGAAAMLNIVKDIPIHVAYGKSNFQNNAGVNLPTNDNEAWGVMAGYNRDNWGIAGHYGRVEADYAAPGDWGRIGTNWSPRNVEGFGGSAWFNLSGSTKLGAEGTFMDFITGAGDVTSAKVWLEHSFNEYWNAKLGYEDVKTDSTTNVRQKWMTVGFNYMMGKSSTLNFTYQYGDVQNGSAWGIAPVGNYKGSLVTSTLSIRF